MPKVHITREMIVDAVFAAVRTAGARILWSASPLAVAAACALSLLKTLPPQMVLPRPRAGRIKILFSFSRFFKCFPYFPTFSARRC